MTAQSRRGWHVRGVLIGIVFALVVPSLLFGGLLLWRFAESERAQDHAEALAAAVRTADALDRELGNLSAALRTLAVSATLRRDDLADFERQARAAADALGRPIVLAEPGGRQLVDTRLAPGVAPGLSGLPESLAGLSVASDPIVSDLIAGGASGPPAVMLALPVAHDGRLAFTLAASLDTAFLGGVLRQQRLPQGWVGGIIDGKAQIIARTEDEDRLIGTPASAEFRSRAQQERAIWTGVNPAGDEVLAATARLRSAPWAVGVGVPLRIVEAPLRRTLAALAAGGALTLVLACALAWYLARLLTMPLQQLAEAGQALGEGRPVQPVPSSIVEMDMVSDALVRAMSDLRQRAGALAAERARLAAIIETVPAGLLIAEGRDGRVVAGNRQLGQMLRHPALASGGLAAYDTWAAFHPGGQPVDAAELPLAQVLRGEDHAELICRYRRGDGSMLWVLCLAAPIRSADATTGGVVALLDIDEVVRAREEKARSAEQLETQVAERTGELEAANRKLRDEVAGRARAEEQLRQSQKMEAVGRLTGGIAHDFNNLLTVVMGSLDLLRRRNPDERSRRLVDNALEGAARAATLTARLLAFSRQTPLIPQPLDVNKLVAGMSDLLHRALGETIKVETVLAGGLWRTHADPNQLENALLNLAVNARDAIVEADPAGGKLTIETANAHLDDAYAATHEEVDAGQYVLIAVTDTGTGMTPDIVARVFEPFFTTKPQGQGTGLGLSQVHGFVKQSGGNVTVYTEPGHGTTIKVYLPRFLTPDLPAPVSPRAAAEEPAADGETILVVEDEAGVRRFTTDALRELGYAVLEAGSAAAALRLLDGHPEIDLLFTDVVLPETNGRQLADEARRRRPGLPVLFTTGYTRNAIVHNGQLDAGVDLIGKPFTMEALAAKLREVLARKRP